MTVQAARRSRRLNTTPRVEGGLSVLRSASFILSLATLFFILSSLRGIAFLLFFPWAMPLASALAIAAMTISVRRLWRDGGERLVAKLGVPILLIASALGIPAIVMVLLGESGSAFAYVAYLAFLPSGLLIGAHIALFAVTIALRSEGPIISYFGGLALVGALGSPVLAATLFYFDVPEVFALGIGLTTVALAFVLAINASAARMVSRGASEPAGT